MKDFPNPINPIFITFLVISFHSCSFFEEGDLVPAYLIGEAARVNTSPGEGSDTHQITDLWLYFDGTAQGVFPLPASVPVIHPETEKSITIFAGIRNNGIQSNPVFYPFYENNEIVFSAEEGTETMLDLTFGYRPDVHFALIEEFEGNHIFQSDIDEDPETFIEIDHEIVLTGAGSGRIRLTQDHNSIEVATTNVYQDLPVDGQPVYLEMDYKNDIELLVGLIGSDPGSEGIKFYKLALNPRENWNKVYVDFTEDLIQSQFTSYRILIGAEIPGSATEEAMIYLDNIKLIHFE